MNKILLTILCSFTYLLSLNAQTLFGTTSGGGTYGAGTINKYITGTNKLTVLKSFENLAYHPYDNVIQATDGKLYGLSYDGGQTFNGVIFSFNPSDSTYKTLYDFDFQNGFRPMGHLVQASDGKLYGLTSEGGSNETGVIFSFDPVSLTYTRVKDFDYYDDEYPDVDSEGAYPLGSLVQANDGKLYGTTYLGGSNNGGVIFSFDPSSAVYTKVCDLKYNTGAYPTGSLIQAKDGKLYGLTYEGGKGQAGVIFSFNPSSSVYTKLKDFDNKNGGNPGASLVQASDGKLYGLTAYGGKSDNGVIFSFDPSSLLYKKIRDFDGTNGRTPFGSLIQAGNGILYGMTYEGGTNNAGVLFSLTPASSAFKKLKDFNNQGWHPLGSLTQASNGNLYGLTKDGGYNDGGIIFSFTPSSSTYKKLRNIASNETGTTIRGKLVRANDKKLYGMSYSGGNIGAGTIFSFTPSTSTFNKLKDFDYINGGYPLGCLMQAGNGKLYGMTSSGGSKDHGVIFSFDPVTSAYKKLKDFDGVTGAHPWGFMQEYKGKLYGMTSSGGSKDQGVIFSFDLSNSSYQKLKDFDSSIGSSPLGSLMMASNGKFYGTTTHGGSHDYGVIFSFDPATSTYKKLTDFDFSNGAYPYCTLLQASNGKLYGTTAGGGVPFDDHGVIFSFDLVTSTVTNLKNLEQYRGANPVSGLMQASNGTLYGGANYGNEGSGVIFSFDLYSSTYTSLRDFTGIDGYEPYSEFIEVKDCIAGTTYYQDADGDGFGDRTKSITGCPVIRGYVDNGNDCNDLDPAIHPGAAEICNGIDDDCDGYTDSTIVEAEQAVLHGALVAATVAGYTGTGYADCQNEGGDYMEWTVNVNDPGTYSLRFRYANGAAANRPLQLEINGLIVAGDLPFMPTGGWSVWSFSSTTGELVNGINKIRLTTTAYNGPNIDHLNVAAAGCSPGFLEAEKAVLSGAAVTSAEPGYTGTGYADYNSGAGNYIEWTITNLPAGSYYLKFRYANGGTTNRPMQLKINGNPIVTHLDFPPTGGWSTWSISSAPTYLTGGINTIRLTTEGSQGPNVDHLKVEPFACQQGMLEAEQAVFNGAAVKIEQPGFTGAGYIDYNSGPGNYIEWTVNAEVTGAYALRFRYANGGISGRPLTLTINGAVIAANMAFSPTGGWAVWSLSSLMVNLTAGANKIRLTTTSQKGPNIDNLAFGCSRVNEPMQLALSSKEVTVVSPAALSVVVMPNPIVNNIVKLAVANFSAQPVEVAVIDMAGRTYKQFKTTIKSANTIHFPVNNLPPGAYTVVLKQANVSTHARLVVAR